MIIWTDIEATGLSERNDHLLEVALVVTDDSLNETAATSVVCKPVGVELDTVIANCDKVVREMHTKNGLWDDVKNIGIRRHEAEARLFGFLTGTFVDVPDVASHDCVNCGKNEKDHTIIPAFAEADESCHCQDGRLFAPKILSALSQTPLAGSTVGFDGRFIREHMPELSKCWHYRSIDVSSFTEMAKRWAPEVYKNRPKNEVGAAHRALADVRESIACLRYFRWAGFITTNPVVAERQP